MNEGIASKKRIKRLPYSLCIIVLLVLSPVIYGQQSIGPSSPPAPSKSVTASKFLVAPTLDGQDKDPAYAQAGILKMTDASGHFTTQVVVLHSGLDLYLYFSKMPRIHDRGVEVRRIAVRVDSNHSREKMVMPGDYEFSVDVKGTLNVAQGNGKDSFVPLKIPASDFAAVVSNPTDKSWSAELRISLEWFGGYARTDGLSLALEAKDGAIIQQWPASAKALSPTTWGDLVLNPIYPKKVTAGSVFLDGREGHLVVPYAPELNPSEITIEAWVRVVDGDWGTLVGNGQDTS